MKKIFVIGSVVLLLLLIAGAAFAQQDRDREGRKGKIIIGTIDSIDIENGTLVIVADKYWLRGEGEVDAKGEKVELSIGERTKCGLEMDRAELGDFKAGMEVVVVTIERDGKLFAVAMSDPDTAKMMRERMENRRNGEGRDGGRDGMRGGGRGGMRGGDRGGMRGGDRGGMRGGGPGMGPCGEGMGPCGGPGMGPEGNRPGGGRPGHGIPIYGEVIKFTDNKIVVKIMEFPIDQLDIPALDDRPHAGINFSDKFAQEFPDGVTIELTDNTRVMVGGEPADLSAVKVGTVFMFRCMPPKGEWTKENHPDYFIAKVIADLDTIKQHIGERRDAPRGGW